MLGSWAMALACAGAKPAVAPARGPAPTSAADRAMAQVSELYLDASLAHSPVTASYLGYHKYDGKWPDWTPAGIDRSLQTLKRFEREVGRIEEKQLSPAYAIDRQLILARIASERFQLTELRPAEWDVQAYNEAIGSGLYYLTLPPADPAAIPTRRQALLERLEGLPRFLEVAKQRLKAPPKAHLEFVLAQNPGNAKTIEETLPPLFEDQPALKDRFTAAKQKAVAAINDYQKWLEQDLSKQATGTFRLGRPKWEAKLRHTLETEVSVAELEADAKQGLAALRFQMYDLALPLYRQLRPADTSYQALSGDERINLVVGTVLNEAAKEHGTPETFFADVKAQADKITRFLEQSQLIALPPKTDNFVIEPTPPFLDGLAVAFYNPAPAFEPDVKKSYWISTVPKPGTPDAESYLREYNRYMLQALTIHEAFPGHYVQLYWSSHSPYASIVKQVLESGTMTEGWAVMIEQLVHEAGYADDDPKCRLFHLKMRLRVYLNAILDLMMHTSTAPEAEVDAQALEMLTTQGFQETAEATRKIRRAKLTSTQLSTYFVGYREMLGIYRDGQKKPNFQRKAFLEKMIGYGSIPPAMIRKLLQQDGLL